MFGHRYFGARYFGGRYWGDGGSAVTTVVESGRYRRINLHALKQTAKKKKKEDELAELQRLLEDVAKSAPKPELQSYVPRVYVGPLATGIFPDERRTEAGVRQIIAKARAEAERQRQDEDDEAAAMLLLSTL